MEIPGYKLGREVQAGQLFTTYNALDVEHSKTVTVKVFHETLSKDPEFQNHFREIAQRLVDQPLTNNVDYLDAIVTDNACAIVTNYSPRSTLQQEDFSDFSEEEVLTIGAQLVGSLSQLHNLGIVHGGVELSNISFLDSGDIVLETVAPQRTMPGNIASKLDSRNPQDAAGLAPEANSGLTISSDYFSLGVVLYEMLLGRKPFSTDTMAEMEQQKQPGQYLTLTDEFAHLGPLFDGLLSPDPRSRIASAEHFISIVSACRMGDTARSFIAPVEPVDTKPENPPVPPTAVNSERQPAKRALLIAAVPAFAVVAAIVFFVVSGTDESAHQVSGQQQSSEPGERPAPIVEALTVTQPSQLQTEADGFYASARALVQEGDYQAALQAIDGALELDTDNEAAKRFRIEIEQELKTHSEAKVDPPVVGPAPDRDQPASTSLPDSDARENEAEDLAATRRAEQQRAERQRAAELAAQRRLARERKAREDEAERLAAQELEIAARNAEISQRLTAAERQLTSSSLSWPALKAAESEYRVLVELANDDARVSDLYRKIVDSHVVLANQQKDAALLPESMTTTNRGLALDSQNKQLLALRDEIADAIKKSEQEEVAIPVIGTF